MYFNCFDILFPFSSRFVDIPTRYQGYLPLTKICTRNTSINKCLFFDDSSICWPNERLLKFVTEFYSEITVHEKF